MIGVDRNLFPENEATGQVWTILPFDKSEGDGGKKSERKEACHLGRL